MAILTVARAVNLCARRYPPETQGLGDVDAADALGAVEIGDGARHAQNAVIPPRRQFHPVDGVGQQRLAGGVRRGDRIQKLAVGFGVGADRRVADGAVTDEALIASGLHGARLRDARRDLGRTLGWRRQRQVARRNGGDIDVEVDAIEYRPGNLRLILLGAFRHAGAGETCVVEMAATAETRCLFAGRATNA
jgi:hypothetical protein